MFIPVPVIEFEKNSASFCDVGVADWRRCVSGGSGLQSWATGEERQRTRQAGTGERGQQSQNLQISPGKLPRGVFFIPALLFQPLTSLYYCALQRTLQKQSMTYGGKSTVRDRSSGTSSSVAFTPLQVRTHVCSPSPGWFYLLTILLLSVGAGDREPAGCREEGGWSQPEILF